MQESQFKPGYKIVGFFHDDKGNYSLMRLMSFISLFASIAFGLLTITKPHLKDVGIELSYSFLVAAFIPKAIQKQIEK
jgi:hypothetical protein